ncbi:phosphopantetheine attachment site [Lucifera butyrica]|uniref:Phosphopantetheine attachment site n=1 Tax=Lucifera butyrica TaxID=1351585 RepID=A0A498R1T9_9FIRM|nr:non-ribosomal peptide synthetase [Lucifera butyrica]VBB05119.1 phosphopantetheine attachment site [Lucifera butyrica]
MLLDKHSQNIAVASGDYEEEKNYWLGKLDGEINPAGFPGDKVPNDREYVKGIFKSTFPDNIFRSIRRLTNQSEYAVYVMLLSGIQYLLYRYTDNSDLLIGMPIFKQDADEVYFNSMLPLRSKLDTADTLQDLLAKTKDLVMEADSYQNYPLDKIYGQLNLGLADSGELAYKTVVLLENIHEKKISDDLQSDTLFSFLLSGNSLTATVEYNAALYTAERIKQVIHYLFNYFREVAEDPQIKLAAIEMLSPAEKRQILLAFNDTAASYPHQRTIQSMFEEQVEKTPDRVAVTFQEQRLTYRELNEKANQLARELRQNGVKANHIVGIMVERSLEMIIGILGILKAGGAYLPISPDYPAERIHYMLEDSGTEILLTQNRLQSRLSFKGRIIDLEAAGIYCGDGSNLPPEHTSRDLAYVIYTSGSTGKPKGVMIEHYSVINRIHWMQKFYQLTEQDVILQKTPFTFDVSVWELVWWFFTGASVCLLKPGGEKEPAEIVKAIEKNKVTTLHFVPSMLSIFLHYIEQQPDLARLVSLKRVFASGEALNPEHANQFNRLFADRGVKLINLYGPTEATVDVSYFDCSTGGSLETVPIGKPVDNIKLYIVNKNNKLQPVGVAGELCIAGDGLARGYLNKPELTAEKFTANPFVPGARMYRTGDLARWLPDGNIEFLGRIDHQVKIRGFRIELGEIETELVKQPFVKEAVVVAKTGKDGDKYLCAYYVAERELTVPELRDHLAANLPDYMIPAYFVPLAAMPLSPNGKADRKVLPEPTGPVNTGVEYVAPVSETEAILAKVWQEVLKVDRVGRKDNFFSLGGDSIKAIQVLSRLSQYGLTLDMRDIFKYPVIEKLADQVKVASRKAEQGIIRGEVGFTPMQHWLLAQNFPDRHHFNQAVMLGGKNRFEESCIRRVFARLAEHHDALRLVVRAGQDGRTVQFNRGLEGDLFSLETVHLLDSENYREIIEQEAERLQESIDLAEGPLVKLGLFKTKARDYLLIVIHHLAIDGVSWRILLQDFFTGYRQTLQGEEIAFPDKTSSFKDWSDGCYLYANSRELLSETEYWQGMEKAAVKPLPKDRTAKEKKSAANAHIQLRLTEAETERLLRQTNAAYTTEVNDILLAALGLTVKEWAGVDKVMVNLEGHGREEIIKGLDLARTIGWFTAQYPVVLDMSGSRDLAYRIKAVKETLRQIPNKGTGYGILQYLTRPENKQTLNFQLKPEINFNYLGQFDGDVITELFDIADMPIGRLISPSMENLYALDISGMVVKGRLTLHFTYSQAEYEEETIVHFADLYLQNLTRITDHCAACDTSEMTPSDFTLADISLEGLEALEAGLRDIE